MRKFFTIIAALLLSVTAMAQSYDAMYFAGEATFGGTFYGTTVSQTNPSDTITFKMNDMTTGDITIPALTFTQMSMTIPSFTIHNATFTFDFSTFEATFTADQEINETITTDKGEKAFVGKISSAKYQKSDNSFNLSTTYKYGSMPGEITYVIKAFYVKPEGIETILANRADAPVYDLSGRKVSALNKGQIYLQNGRKFIAE